MLRRMPSLILCHKVPRVLNLVLQVLLKSKYAVSQCNGSEKLKAILTHIQWLVQTHHTSISRAKAVFSGLSLTLRKGDCSQEAYGILFLVSEQQKTSAQDERQISGQL